jgi:hypothetical protein
VEETESSMKREAFPRYLQITPAGGQIVDENGNYIGTRVKAEAVRRYNLHADLLKACKLALSRLDRLDDAGTGQHSAAYLTIREATNNARKRGK